eukprot:g494.t1
MMPILIGIIYFALSITVAVGKRRKIRIADVSVLTFQEGQVTESNKGEPVEQIQCISGCIGNILQARCKNDGTDDWGEVNWRCTASIPKGCKFAKSSVSCERYRGDPNLDEDDGWIVPGSCAFVFGLECDRLEEAQTEEKKIQNSIRLAREVQQQEMLREIARSRNQAEKDACELAIQGALYPLNHAVIFDNYRRGRVSRISCDGTYSITFDDDGVEISGLLEDQLAPIVDPIFTYVTVTNSAPPSRPSQSSQSRSSRHSSSPYAQTYSSTYGSSESKGLFSEDGMGFPIIICFVAAIVLYFVLKNPSPSSSSRRRPISTDDVDPNANAQRRNVRRSGDDGGVAKTAVAAALAMASAANVRGSWSRQQHRFNQTSAPGMNRFSAGEGRTTTTRRRNVAGEESVRTSKKEALAVEARARLERTKAELKRREDGRVHEYNTRAEHTQRKITTDTQQLGNQMNRTDHVRDESEGVAYAKTSFR